MREVTVRVNGRDYPLPHQESLTLGELIAMKRYGVTPRALQEDPQGEPGVLPYLIHIAIKRAEPDVKDKDIAETVAAMKLAELAIAVDGEAVSGPLASGSESSASAETPHSGGTGSDASAPSRAPSTLASTGAPASGTGPA